MRFVFRFIVFLLIPCLLIDPAAAAGLSIAFSFRKIEPISHTQRLRSEFEGEALVGAVLRFIQPLDPKLAARLTRTAVAEQGIQKVFRFERGSNSGISGWVPAFQGAYTGFGGARSGAGRLIEWMRNLSVKFSQSRHTDSAAPQNPALSWARVTWRAPRVEPDPAGSDSPRGSLPLRSDADALALVPDLSDLSSRFEFEVAVEFNDSEKLFVQVIASEKQALRRAFPVFQLLLACDADNPDPLILAWGQQPPGWEKIHERSEISLGERYRAWFNVQGKLDAWAATHRFHEMSISTVRSEDFLRAYGWDIDVTQRSARRRVQALKPANPSADSGDSHLTRIKTKEKVWRKFGFGLALWCVIWFPLLGGYWGILVGFSRLFYAWVRHWHRIAASPEAKTAVEESLAVHGVSWWYEALPIARIAFVQVINPRRAEIMIVNFLKAHYTEKQLDALNFTGGRRGWETLPGWREREWTLRLLIGLTQATFVPGLIFLMFAVPDMTFSLERMFRLFSQIFSASSSTGEFFEFMWAASPGFGEDIVNLEMILIRRFWPLAVALLGGHELHNLLSTYPLTADERHNRGPQRFGRTAPLLARAA